MFSLPTTTSEIATSVLCLAIVVSFSPVFFIKQQGSLLPGVITSLRGEQKKVAVNRRPLFLHHL